MTRPTLVIGLGGTGHWVLTYLKKELLEIGKGQIPPEIRLLGIDTAMGDIAVGGGAVKDAKNEKNQLGDVKLSDHIEFLQIGDDLYNLVQEINKELCNKQLEDRNRRYKHLYWFPATELLKKLMAPAFNSIFGAGAIRQLGRLSLFNKIAEIRNMIQSKVTELQSYVQYEENQEIYNSLEVLIVGSFAGGTGAGTLIDVGYITKSIIKNLHIPKCQVRGFIVMPSAFHGMALNADPEKLWRSFAAWTELDRFMLVNNQQSNPPEIYYSPSNNIKVVCDEPPFDLTYIVDANRQPLPLQPPPTEGIFPAIAQAIMFIVDSKSGPFFSQDLINTVAGIRSTLPVGVYHSAIGTFTIKVPSYFEQSKAARSLSKNVLELWLQPSIVDNLVTSVGSLIKESGGLPDAGMVAANNFLHSATQNDLEGNQFSNTMFFPKVEEVHSAYHAHTLPDLVIQISKSTISQAQSSWVNALITNTGSSQEDKDLENKIKKELFESVTKTCPPSMIKNDTPAVALTRLTNGAPSYILKKFGNEDNQGVREGGTVREVLRKARDYQYKRFKILLRVWLNRVLVGLDSNPINAKAGKLGYVLETLDEMRCAFDVYASFNSQIQTERAKNARVSAAKNNLFNSEGIYRRDAGKTTIFAPHNQNVHPDAHDAQRNYLKAVDNLCDTLRDEELILTNIQTAEDCKKFVENTKNEVIKWIEVLATGREGAMSLYNKLKTSMKGMEDNLDLDKRLGNSDFSKTQSFAKIMQLVGNTSSVPVTEDQVSEAMRRIVWKVNEDGEGLSISCLFNKPARNEDEQDQLIPLVTALNDKTETNQTGTDYNLTQLIQLTEQPYAHIAYNNKINDELKKVAPNGELLAKKLLGIAEPFYALANTSTNPADHSVFIQMDKTLDATYLNQFKVAMEGLMKNKGIRINLADSEDPYRFTFIRCDDLIPSESFQIRSTLNTEYQRVVTSKIQSYKEIHIFPSVQNTLFYEQKIPDLLQVATAKFHPELSGLHENPWHFDLWFFANEAGFIRETASGIGKSTWNFQLPEEGSMQIQLFRPQDIEGVAGERQYDVYFDAIRGFLSGHDYRPDMVGVGSARIDWNKLNDAFLAWEQSNLEELQKCYKAEKDGTGPVISRIMKELEDIPQEYKERFTQLALAGRVVFADRLKLISK
jgi:hypothetical protein